ncbi:MAG TPA: FHA domain-containing protein [Myxococcota bacterium]|nr:FHA domain-containing protein [Myxococcota bacterium]HQK51617.1 FHA domain-containing protein [Myxococcota bacterium]
MPTLVLHVLNKPAQKTTCEGPEIRIGRAAEANHVVLPSETVSREHVVLRQGRDGRWVVHCVSETNPIVVDGVLTTSSVVIGEGSEILVGTEHLLIFSENEATAKSYLGATSHFVNSECSRCHWSGMVSTLRRQPVCPKCGGTDLRAEDVYRRDQAAAQAPLGSTSAVDMQVVKSQLARLKSARRSRIERIDGREPARRDLSERESLVIGKGPGAHLALVGFAWGAGLRIWWDGGRWVATSSLRFPSMKVNGSPCKMSALHDGDIVEVGSNRFRFVTE